MDMIFYSRFLSKQYTFSEQDDNELTKNLPREILIRIFSFLDVISLCRCAQVNQLNLMWLLTAIKRAHNAKQNSVHQVSRYWNILALDGSSWQKIDLFDFQRDIEVNFTHISKQKLVKYHISHFQVLKPSCVSKQGPVIENISQRCGGFLKYLSLKGCQSVGDQSFR